MFRYWSRALYYSRSLNPVALPGPGFSRNQVAKSTGSVEPDIRAWNKRISHFIRMDELDQARNIFDTMPLRNTVSWNAMISGYVRRREALKARKLFDEMPERDRDVVSWNLILSGYVSCHHGGWSSYLDEGRTLFDQMPVRDSVSWNTMISGYAKIGRMDIALSLFNVMPKHDTVTWNTMVSGFLRNGEAAKAVDWFERMPTRDFSSLSALVSGLIWNDKLDEAREFILKSKKTVRDGGDEDLLHAYNTLIGAYGQKGRICEACNLFAQIPMHPQHGHGKRKFARNVVSWNTMIMCYVKAGDVVSARALFDQMVERDSISWNTMINGYVQQSNMMEASKLFCQMPTPDTYSWNMMVSGHAQTKSLELALYYFENTPVKNIVSWNTILSGYEKNGDYIGGIDLFIEMLAEGERPDKHTLSSVLSVATGFVALDLGMQIHQMLVKMVVPDMPINNSLLTMYSRCGAIVEAEAIFEREKFQRDVITWNAMIGGYASHGYAVEALELFGVLKKLRIQPTYITFISVLHACAHVGLVDEGRKQFRSMFSDFGIEPRVEHFAALVDILAKTGQLPEVMDLINSMPIKPNKSVWGALLSACRIHKNVEFAKVAGEALIKLDPKSPSPYIMLYNTYVDLELWEDAAKVREIPELNILKKQCGSSWLDVVPT